MCFCLTNPLINIIRHAKAAMCESRYTGAQPLYCVIDFEVSVGSCFGAFAQLLLNVGWTWPSEERMMELSFLLIWNIKAKLVGWCHPNSLNYGSSIIHHVIILGEPHQHQPKICFRSCFRILCFVFSAWKITCDVKNWWAQQGEYPQTKGEGTLTISIWQGESLLNVLMWS